MGYIKKKLTLNRGFSTSYRHSTGKTYKYNKHTQRRRRIGVKFGRKWKGVKNYK